VESHILFVCYGGGHAKMLVPVIKQLSLRSGLKLTVLALTTAATVMKENSIPYIGYKDLTHLVKGGWYLYGNRLIGDDTPNSTVSKEESLAYHGINYLDLI
ncbi:MAG: hypothetical protein RPR97_00385, partial [Colwellia sp.]